MATQNVLFIGGVADGRREDIGDEKNTVSFAAVVERPRIPDAGETPDLNQTPVLAQHYRRFWITRTVSVFVENSISGDQVIGLLVSGYSRGQVHNELAGLSAVIDNPMYTVRRNLLTRKNYTPYCGSVRCSYNMPRTMFNGHQFQCQCGWRSGFEPSFIAQYIEFNRAEGK